MLAAKELQCHLVATENITTFKTNGNLQYNIMACRQQLILL